MSVRTRIAPSPTGDPHVGTAYAALFNYAFARKHGGQFILRIEDTDRQRSNPASEAMIFESLRWLGLSWDEGPDVGGPFGPYRQSERVEVYREHAERLVASGHAYPCFCSKERLDQVRLSQQRAGAPVLGYDGFCRGIPPEEAAARRRGEPHTIRLAMPREGTLVVHDLLRGAIQFDAAMVDDQVLLKSDGFPTYHLANVVDDHLMGITHVIRAEEWLSSLPKHVQLYKAFGWSPPVFCHLPLLRNADRSKISKRKNPVSLNFYRRAGFLPEALLNYLALMGWTMPDGREEFTLAEFVDALQLERITLGGPVFDLEKLSWLNGRYIRRMSPQELLARLRGHLLGDEYLLRVLPLVRERISRLEDFMDYGQFFFVGELHYDQAALAAMVPSQRTPQEVAGVLRAFVQDHVDPALVWEAAALEEACRAWCGQRGWPAKDFFTTVRVAVTGRTASPPLFQTMEVLGKETCRRRLHAAATALARWREEGA